MRGRYDSPFKPERRSHRGGCLVVLITLALIISVVVAVNAALNSHATLQTQKVTVSSLPSALENFSVLHLSDLHGARLGDGQNGILNALSGVSYQAVCITGDMSAKNGSYSAFIELLQALPDSIPVYFILGDEDPAKINSAPDATEPLSPMILAAQAEGAIFLDAPQALTVGKNTVWFSPAGSHSLDLDAQERTLNNRRAAFSQGAEAYTADHAASLRAIDYELDVVRRTREARAQMKEGDIHIVLAHTPLSTDTLTTLRLWSDADKKSFLNDVSLILAGHLTNGQWRLPGLGAVYVPGSLGLTASGFFPGEAGLSGLSNVLGIAQYVSPGLGASSVYPWMPFRLMNPPTVTQLILTRKLQ